MAEPKKDKAKRSDEVIPVLYVSTWVRLASTPNVPERFHGTLAHIVEAPVERVESGLLSPRPYDVQDPEAEFSVRTRGSESIVLTGLTRKDFTAVSSQGRHELEATG